MLAGMPSFYNAKKNIIISIHPRETSTTIAHNLQSKGVILYPILFKIAYKFLSIKDSAFGLKVGDFEIREGMNYYEICKLLSSNKYHFNNITFPEGLTVKQIIELLSNNNINGQITRNIKEGTLMPETYNYTSFDTKDSILQRMENEMTKFLDKAWSENKNLMLKSKEELLIFASITEKETGIDEERGLVASIFTNRLKLGMKLQSDPTIIYEITNGETNFGRKITKADINNGKDYNTYKIPGLPKGPIACPGRASILASINPKESDYLYFVAIGDNSGRHKFAINYKDHLKNVDEYRKMRTEREMQIINGQ